MKKSHLALKILLPLLVVLMIAWIVLEVRCLDSAIDNKKGLLFVGAFFLNFIPIIARGVFGIGLTIISIFLFVAKKKTGSIVCALVFLYLLAQVSLLSFFIDIVVLRAFIEVPIMSAIVLVVNIAALVSCIVEIHRIRKHKKMEYAQTIDDSSNLKV